MQKPRAKNLSQPSGEMFCFSLAGWKHSPTCSSKSAVKLPTSLAAAGRRLKDCLSLTDERLHIFSSSLFFSIPLCIIPSFSQAPAPSDETRRGGSSLFLSPLTTAPSDYSSAVVFKSVLFSLLEPFRFFRYAMPKLLLSPARVFIPPCLLLLISSSSSLSCTTTFFSCLRLSSHIILISF